MSSSTVSPAQDNIISIDGKRIVLANDVGCKLVIYSKDGRYGLGTFYVQGVALGDPIKCFLTEENVGNNTADQYQRVWPGRWEPYFSPTKYQVLENSAKRGSIRFSGAEGSLEGSITVTLCQGATGYLLDYDMVAQQTIKHPLHINAPFFADKMEFVGFPFENPLRQPFAGHWSIQPTRSTVPLLLGCEKIRGQSYYIGLGYCLTEPFERGRVTYDTADKNPLELQFISPSSSGWLGRAQLSEPVPHYRTSLVISTATNQYDCVAGYRRHSGYDVSVPTRRSLDDSLTGIMQMYKNCSVYVSLPPWKNKAYRQQIDPANGLPKDKGYGLYVPIGVNVQLAFQFYRYWQSHPEETWALDRATNMAGFFVETQQPSGAVPTLWDTRERRFRAYEPRLDKAGYRYATCQQAMGAYSLYRLYLARKAGEHLDEPAWRAAACRAMDDLVRKIKPDGFLGRSYDENGNYDATCAPDWPLIALDYFAAQTGEAKYEKARARLEKFAYEHFICINHWFGWSSDHGWWPSETPPPYNVDALNSMSLATYSVFRYQRTGDPKYLEWAKHVIAYNWLVSIPIQFPEFKHVTKGLVREQDFYVTYDLPFRTCLYIDGFPYLSEVTGDRFFADFYRLMIQTQMAYQNSPPRFQSFDIGLWWNDSGAEPRDATGEEGSNYIVEFCSLFLESVTSPGFARYVGGPDWGVGLDYDLNFTPAFERNGPYVTSSSSRLTGASWDAQSRILRVTLSGQAGTTEKLALGWTPGHCSAERMRALLNGKPIAPQKTTRSSPKDKEVYCLSFLQEAAESNLEIVFR